TPAAGRGTWRPRRSARRSASPRSAPARHAGPAAPRTACGPAGTWSANDRCARASCRSTPPADRRSAPPRNYPWPSSVHLTKYQVISTDHRADVGEHVAAHDLVHRGQVRETRRAQLHAEGLVGAVGHQIAAELALRRLDRGVGLAGRHAIAFAEEL